jgi:enoyl-CoA hydratase/carnithine racemase
VIRTGKQAFYKQVDRALEDAYDFASDVMACNVLLEDAAEGMDAFLQKRTAKWHGR